MLIFAFMTHLAQFITNRYVRQVKFYEFAKNHGFKVSRKSNQLVLLVISHLVTMDAESGTLASRSKPVFGIFRVKN